MDERIFFADVELPFHVWVRESTGGNGYRWVLRAAPPAQGEAQEPEGSGTARPHEDP